MISSKNKAPEQARVTLTKVAQEAGISIAAVSSFLNGRNYGIRLGEDTERSIIMACRKLGYTASSEEARRRIYPETGDICFMLPADMPMGFQNPYFHRMMVAIEEALATEEGNLTLARFDTDTDYQRNPDKLPPACGKNSITKFIMAGIPNIKLIRTLRGLRRPVVCIGHDVGVDGVHRILVDYRKATMEAVRYLHAQGHRRIAYLSGPFGNPGYTVIQLNAGYAESLQEVGLSFASKYVAFGQIAPLGGSKALHEILEMQPRPTAVLCMSDVQASGMIQCALSLGIRVPQDISIMGCNDDPVAVATSPAITTMRFPLEEMGKSAVSIFSSYFEEGSFPVNQRVFSPELIERESVSAIG